MSFVVIVKIDAYESPGAGFIPTLQLEEHDLPRITFIPFHFSGESAKETHEEAVAVAEREAIHIINQRYQEGTKYRIAKQEN